MMMMMSTSSLQRTQSGLNITSPASAKGLLRSKTNENKSTHANIPSRSPRSSEPGQNHARFRRVLAIFHTWKKTKHHKTLDQLL
jgi:hypothetical protein